MYDELLESSEFYQKQYHNFSSRIIIPTCVLTIFIILFSLFAKKELTISVTAQIIPNKILMNIQSKCNNSIKLNNMVENKTIQKGDVLLEYDFSVEQSKYNKSLEHLTSLKDQLEKINLLYESVLSNQNKLNTMDSFGYKQLFDNFQSQVTNYKIEFNKNKELLLKQGSFSSTQKNELQNKIKQLQTNTLVEISKNIYSIKTNISTAELDLEFQKNELQKGKIIAESDGILHLNSEVSDLSVISEGTLIGQIYPKFKKGEKVKIESYINSLEISKIMEGEKLKFETLDRGNKKSHFATVTAIDIIAKKYKDTSFFKVVSEIDSLDEDSIENFKYGLEGNAVFLLDEKSYFNYYIDKFFNNK